MGAALCQNVLRQNVLERQNNWTAAFQWRSGAHLSLCNLNTVFVNATFKYYAYFLLLFVFASVLRNMNTMNDISQTKCNVSLKAFVIAHESLEQSLWRNTMNKQNKTSKEQQDLQNNTQHMAFLENPICVCVSSWYSNQAVRDALHTLTELSHLEPVSLSTITPLPDVSDSPYSCQVCVVCATLMLHHSTGKPLLCVALFGDENEENNFEICKLCALHPPLYLEEENMTRLR